jgi:hypothetical protein
MFLKDAAECVKGQNGARHREDGARQFFLPTMD